MTDVVATREQGARLDREPLLVLEPLEEFLDVAGLGVGAVRANPIGDGHSNVTYAIDRSGERFVLRRPPRGPLAPSAHDVLREARLLTALAGAGVRVPEVVAVCEDPSVIGAPFYVMPFIEGDVLSGHLPQPFRSAEAGERIADQMVECLVEIHAVDVDAPALSQFGRGGNYCERQVRRFSRLLEQNATRSLPELEDLAAWLGANLPRGNEVTVVHGDYRLGNMMFTAEPSLRLVAVLDWEMATLGDPLADLGYMTAMWAQAGDPDDPMLELSAVTRLPGFPERDRLIERYVRRSGRAPSDLIWYETLAVWKAAVFLEGSYKRFLAGNTDDGYFARLDAGVPALARRAVNALADRGF